MGSKRRVARDNVRVTKHRVAPEPNVPFLYDQHNMFETWINHKNNIVNSMIKVVENKERVSVRFMAENISKEEDFPDGFGFNMTSFVKEICVLPEALHMSGLEFADGNFSMKRNPEVLNMSGLESAVDQFDPEICYKIDIGNRNNKSAMLINKCIDILKKKSIWILNTDIVNDVISKGFDIENKDGMKIIWKEFDKNNKNYGSVKDKGGGLYCKAVDSSTFKNIEYVKGACKCRLALKYVS